MKRIVCLTLLICLVNAPTQLQAGKRLSNKLKSTRVGRAFGKLAQTERFSRILDKRLRTSFETARELQKSQYAACAAPKICLRTAYMQISPS